MFRIIKTVAILLVVVIVITIVSSLVFGISIVDGIMKGEWKGAVLCTQSGTCEVEDYGDKVEKLEVSVKATNLRIEKNSAKKVEVETNNEYIEQWIDNGTLHVVEKSHGIFGFGGQGEVVVKVPEEKKFDTVKIEVGAGMLTAEKLAGKIVELNLGAGKTEIRELVASSNASVNGGAGLLDILGGEVNNAEIKIGAGKAAIKLKFAGANTVNTGVGKLDLTLIGKKSDYMMEINKGIGSVTVSGEEMANGATWSDGSAKVKLNSGVGAVNVEMAEK